MLCALIFSCWSRGDFSFVCELPGLLMVPGVIRSSLTRSVGAEVGVVAVCHPIAAASDPAPGRSTPVARVVTAIVAPVFVIPSMVPLLLASMAPLPAAAVLTLLIRNAIPPVKVPTTLAVWSSWAPVAIDE